MSECKGGETLTAKVDGPTIEKFEEAAEERGVSRSEAVRRVIDTYVQSDDGELQCPCCGKELVFTV